MLEEARRRRSWKKDAPSQHLKTTQKLENIGDKEGIKMLSGFG